MLITNKLLQQIDSIVERSYLAFTHNLLGKDVLTDEQKVQAEAMGILLQDRPLIEILYTLIRQRSLPRYREDKTLVELVEGIMKLGVLPALKDTERHTVDTAKNALKGVLDDTKQKLKKELTFKALEANQAYKNAVIALPTAQARKQKEDMTNKYLLGIGAAVLLSQTNFMKGFVTNLTNMVNGAVVDEAMEKLPGQGVDALCYKIPVRDSRTCSSCLELFIDESGNYKLYRVKDLQANGSNMGLSKNQWKPILGAQHFSCRCQLHYVEPKTR